ncbi:MAG: 50S ribosomal protein L24 [Patescibacteria group bacterium]
MIKFKLGDNVRIMTGKDKGREGKIEKIFPKEAKVLIPGMNIYKKHVKGVGEVKGGIYDLPRPIGLGKIALVCPKCKKITRVGFRMAGSQKVRICKKCKKEIS